MYKFRSKNPLLLIAFFLFAFIVVTGIYAVSRLSSNRVENSTNKETPVSVPIPYTQEEEIVEESEPVGQVQGASIIAPTPVHIPPQIKHTNPELPLSINLPTIPNPNPQPTPVEIIEEDKCSNPENTWLDFEIGDSKAQKFGGDGTQYTYVEFTNAKISGFLSYSCIDRSEIVEMWYDVTSDKVQCYCGHISIPHVMPGTYEMLYLVGVRDVVFYDYINLTIEAKPRPPVNKAPVATILTPHGHYQTIKVEGNSYTFDLYGEMRDEEDGVITLGSSLKWYAEINHGELEYLFDGSGKYTVTVPSCTTVEVIIALHVFDSTGLRRDDAFTVKLKNENCTEVPEVE